MSKPPAALPAAPPAATGPAEDTSFPGGEPRDYVLITVDADKGVYQVDEQNSIVVDAKLAGDTLLNAGHVA